jgi:hypothetical protein
MSNALAIAATTMTLRSLLTGATANVTALTPDKARDGATADQLNLFLYQTLLSAAWRNADMPRQVRPGESGHPPLPLNLHYLITAYAEDEARAHQILGRAMSILHDHMLLDELEIRQATQADLPDSDLHLQLERIRITPHPLSLEEISKLWSGFQTQYRLSAAYEVAVVLIESTRPPRTPLPVLRQGPDDRGPKAQPAGAPFVGEVVPPNGFPAAPLGSTLAIQGLNLVGELAVRFRHPRLAGPIELEPTPGASSGELLVTLPSGAPATADWAPGFMTVSVVSRPPGLPAWSSNEAAFALAPAVTVAPSTAPAGNIDLTLTCMPRMRDGQRAHVLFGERQVAPESVTTPADPAQPTTLVFKLSGVAAGEYVVRLRVDGADSIPFRRAGTPPLPEFDPGQKVVVT